MKVAGELEVLEELEGNEESEPYGELDSLEELLGLRCLGTRCNPRSRGVPRAGEVSGSYDIQCSSCFSCVSCGPPPPANTSELFCGAEAFAITDVSEH